MTRYDKVRKRMGTLLTVAGNRLERLLSQLSSDDIVTLYEEGSNLAFHDNDLERRTVGFQIVNAAVHVLKERYGSALDAADLSKPFPLRDWVNGVPAGS